MTTTKTKKAKPAEPPASRVVNVRISRAAYEIILKEAKLTRRSFIVTLDMILGA